MFHFTFDFIFICFYAFLHIYYLFGFDLFLFVSFTFQFVTNYQVFVLSNSKNLAITICSLSLICKIFRGFIIKNASLQFLDNFVTALKLYKRKLYIFFVASKNLLLLLLNYKQTVHNFVTNKKKLFFYLQYDLLH